MNPSPQMRNLVATERLPRSPHRFESSLGGGLEGALQVRPTFVAPSVRQVQHYSLHPFVMAVSLQGSRFHALWVHLGLDQNYHFSLDVIGPFKAHGSWQLRLLHRRLLMYSASSTLQMRARWTLLVVNLLIKVMTRTFLLRSHPASQTLWWWPVTWILTPFHQPRGFPSTFLTSMPHGAVVRLQPAFFHYLRANVMIMMLRPLAQEDALSIYINIL